MGQVTVESLVEPDGDVPLARLVAEVEGGDVPLAVVTDEVLLLCGQDATAAPRDHWTPWLAALEPDEVEVARTTAMRWLLAQGMARRDGERLTLRQPLSTLSWALEQAGAVVTYGVQTHDDTAESGAFLVLPHGLVLHDVIDRAGGSHVLVFRRPSAAAAWLAAMLDPLARSRRTHPPEVVEGADQLQEAVRALPGRPRSRTVAAAATGGGDDAVMQSVTAVGTTKGLWLVQARGGAEPVGTVQAVGEEDVLAVADALLAITPDADGP